MTSFLIKTRFRGQLRGIWYTYNGVWYELKRELVRRKRDHLKTRKHLEALRKSQNTSKIEKRNLEDRVTENYLATSLLMSCEKLPYHEKLPGAFYPKIANLFIYCWIIFQGKRVLLIHLGINFNTATGLKKSN